MLKHTVKLGDCLDVLKTLPDASVDCIVTDPPYGMTSVNPRGKKTKAKSGFMGKVWDVDVPKTVVLRECLRVLKPGAFAFIMCSPRQDCLAKLILRLQKAGFIIGYSSIYWINGQGFPKAQNLSKRIDKMKQGELNNEANKLAKYLRDKRIEKGLSKTQVDKIVCNGSTMYGWWEGRNKDYKIYVPDWKHYRKLKRLLDLDDRYDDLVRDNKLVVDIVSGDFGYQHDGKRWNKNREETIANSNQAKDMKGAYSGLQLKPSVEVIVVAMRPIEQHTYLDQALTNHKGCTWLDDCRIPIVTEQDAKEVTNKNQHTKFGSGPRTNNVYGDITKADRDDYNPAKGRFPANVLVQDDALKREQNKTTSHSSKNKRNWYGCTRYRYLRPDWYFSDEGSLSRYFDLDAWFSDRIGELPESTQATFPFLYVPKPSRREKNAGLDKLQKKAKREVYGKGFSTATKVDPKLHTKDGMERRPLHANNHPTVKAVKLMHYLITLGSREHDVVLDPYCGSGTTGVAAVNLRRHFFGIELNPEYRKIANARIRHAVDNPPIRSKPTTKADKPAKRQTTLWDKI